MNSNLRIDDLQLNNLKLMQDPKQFCFGIDAVLLSDFAANTIRKGNDILDIGCGNGIIPVLLSAKTVDTRLFGLEIQHDAATLAEQNVELNQLGDRCFITEGDIKESANIFPMQKFDVITCNPPYKEPGGGLINEADSLKIARHEILCTLEDIIKNALFLLRDGGKLCMIHRPERLADILCLMREYRIEPKRLKFVHHTPDKPPQMILVEGAKYGRRKMVVEAPIIVGTPYMASEKGASQ